MFGDGFDIAVESLCYFFQNYTIVFIYQKQYLYSPMIGNSFEMSLKLFGGFHASIIIAQHSYILKNIGISCGGTAP